MPLRYLFLDMNAYFASAEQQDRPELRGQPVGVVPSLVETTCCIAASYEAKRHGVKTGTPVREARRLCPDIRLVEARPPLYVFLHRRIRAAVETCLPVGTVLSVDEMACPLLGAQQQPDAARQLAVGVKTAIRTGVGECLLCSVGLGPNVLLAKIASDLHKPDGLTAIATEDLPQRLYGLQLLDLPGIGTRMLERLHKAGVRTVEQLCALPRDRLAAIWGSRVLGERWYRRLRGEDVPEPPTRRHSVSHSRVLPPAERSDEAARAVLMCLLHKAAARLRSLGYWTGGMVLSVEYLPRGSWQAKKRFTLCRDTLTLVHVLGELWSQRRHDQPLKVGVVLDHLVDQHNATMPLFEEEQKLSALADTMDQLNQRFGKHAVYFGGMHGAQAHARPKIAFGNIPEDV